MSDRPIDETDMEYMLGMLRNTTTQIPLSSDSSTSLSSEDFADFEVPNYNYNLSVNSQMFNNDFSLLSIPENYSEIAEIPQNFGQEDFEQIHLNNFPLSFPLTFPQTVLQSYPQTVSQTVPQAIAESSQTPQITDEDTHLDNVLFSEDWNELLNLIPSEVSEEILLDLQRETSLQTNQIAETPKIEIENQVTSSEQNVQIVKPVAQKVEPVPKFVVKPGVNKNNIPKKIVQATKTLAPIKSGKSLLKREIKPMLAVKPAIKQLSILKPGFVQQFTSEPATVVTPIKITLKIPGQETVELLTYKGRSSVVQPKRKATLQYVINGQEPLKSRIMVIQPNLADLYKNSTGPRQRPLPNSITYSPEKRKMPAQLTQEESKKLCLEKPYACPYCNTRYARLHNMEKHVKQHCTMSTTQACPHCHILVHKPNFDEHIISRHGRTQMMCQFCPEHFKSVALFDRHVVRMHGGEDPVKVKKLRKGIASMYFDFKILEFVQQF